MPPPFPDVPGQRGLATTRQLVTAGWSATQLHHLKSRAGRVLLRGVCAPHRGEPDAATWLVAAWLWAGPGSVLTGGHALRRSGVVTGPLGPPTFVVPRGRRARAEARGVTVRSERPVRYRTLDGVPTVAPARALVDAGLYGELEAADLRAATIATLQRRLSTAGRIRAELDLAPPNGSRPIRLGVADFERGAWSLPEVVLAELLGRHRPHLEFLANPRLTRPDGVLIGVPDAYLPAHGVAILVHSREFHDGFADDGRDLWEATIEADSVYEAHGIAVAAVAPTALRDHPERFLARLDRVVEAQHGRPRPRVSVGRVGAGRWPAA